MNIVDIDTFIEDPYYLGNFFNNSLDSNLRNHLKDIYPKCSESPYSEVLINTSNTNYNNISFVGILYDLYKAILFEDIHKKYKLIKISKIEFAYLNNQIKYSKFFENIFQNSGFFNSNSITKSEDLKKHGTTIHFPNNISFTDTNSNEYYIGKNIISAIINNSKCLKEDYLGILRRIQSRYYNNNRNSPFTIWILNNEKNKSEFLRSYILESKKLETTLIIEE